MGDHSLLNLTSVEVGNCPMVVLTRTQNPNDKDKDQLGPDMCVSSQSQLQHSVCSGAARGVGANQLNAALQSQWREPTNFGHAI